MIRARGLCKRYGEMEVLKGVDLDVADGAFVAVVGRSGGGKSTLLRLIQGLEQPTAGSIEVAAGPGRVRTLFQEPRLLPWARVGENVLIGLDPRLDRREADRAVAAALEQVGLGDRAGDWPGQLSGGQRQRVALARALVSRPALLTLDEPLGALDALTRLEMQALIAGVWAEQRFTAVLVTHDVAEAVTVADRVLVLDGGRIALDRPVDLPRPRPPADPAAAAIEAEVLARLLTS